MRAAWTRMKNAARDMLGTRNEHEKLGTRYAVLWDQWSKLLANSDSIVGKIGPEAFDATLGALHAEIDKLLILTKLTNEKWVEQAFPANIDPTQFPGKVGQSFNEYLNQWPAIEKVNQQVWHTMQVQLSALEIVKEPLRTNLRRRAIMAIIGGVSVSPYLHAFRTRLTDQILLAYDSDKNDLSSISQVLYLANISGVISRTEYKLPEMVYWSRFVTLQDNMRFFGCHDERV